MTTVYLHVGTMKTGTSALQSFLDENRAILEANGYAYPRMDIGLPNRYIYRNGHFLIRHLGEDGRDMTEEDAENLLNAGFEQLGEVAKQFDKMILSDETIWQRSTRTENFWPDLIERFAKINCEIKVIVYLRRQDTSAESLYNQFVKSDAMQSKTFEEYKQGPMIRTFALHYHRNLKRIAKHIKKENIIVRVYEKDQYEGSEHNIYSDFLKYVGLSYSDEYKVGRPAVNLGLRGNYIELKRIINGLPEYRDLDDFMARPLRDASAAKTGGDLHGKVTFFTKEEQKEFLAQFEEGNSKIAKNFLGREDGILFREPLGDLPTWQLDRETLYQDILMSVAETFCRQERKLRDMEDRCRILEERMDERIRAIEEEISGPDGLRDQVTAMHRSLIFRGYRKVRKVLKHQ